MDKEHYARLNCPECGDDSLCFIESGHAHCFNCDYDIRILNPRWDTLNWDSFKFAAEAKLEEAACHERERNS